ncbi:transporter substrate-binding domain-containing protein [Shimazuella sp. AN120528]|nr:transporter substrate-binding domain-containing protein [Shimazuella soli]
MQKRLLIILTSLVLLVSGFVSGIFFVQRSDADTYQNPQKSRLDQIIAQGKIRVGTTGDYKPFTYWNPTTKQYEGYDIDAAKMLANDLGVKVEFVKTTWSTMMQDLQNNKFDIAMGGITRTLLRQKTANLSDPYIQDGKSPLIRSSDKDKFKTLADIDKPDVKIAVNPGGTNEKFVKENIKNAQIITVQNNLEIPKMVAEGQVDVMITDTTEARYYANQDNRLLAILTENPFNLHENGYLMQRGDLDFQNWINLWMDEMKLHGKFKELEKKWISG